jgi:hypothetical protein
MALQDGAATVRERQLALQDGAAISAAIQYVVAEPGEAMAVFQSQEARITGVSAPLRSRLRIYGRGSESDSPTRHFYIAHPRSHSGLCPAANDAIIATP